MLSFIRKAGALLTYMDKMALSKTEKRGTTKLGDEKRFLEGKLKIAKIAWN